MSQLREAARRQTRIGTKALFFSFCLSQVFLGKQSEPHASETQPAMVILVAMRLDQAAPSERKDTLVGKGN